MHKFFSLLCVLSMFALVIGCGGNAETADSSANADRGNSASTSNTDRSPIDDRGATGLEGSSNSDSREESAESTSTDPGEASTSTTLASNGLFPDFKVSSMASAGFGGGLFPQMEVGNDTTNSSVASGEAAPSDDDPFDLGGGFHGDTEAVSTASTSNAGSSSKSEGPSVSLLLDAKRLFESHDEDAAIKYLYANHLISDESREKYKLAWYPGLKEPRLFFRWGVGVIYNQPRDFEGRHPVIGDPGDENEGVSQRQTNNNSRRNSGGPRSLGVGGASTGPGSGGAGRSRGNRVYKNVDTSRPDGFLLYYTGDFGEKLISYLDSRRTDDSDPYYGAILRDVMNVEDPVTEEEQASGRRNNRPQQSGSGPPASTRSSGIAGGDVLGTGGRNSRRGSRGNSRRNNSNAQPLQRTDTSVIDRATGGSTAARPEDDFSGSILPGVHLLGRGSKADLIERAREAEVDTLVLFNVKISKSRGSRNRRSANSAPSMSNTTSMKIVDMKSEDNLFSSKSLKDTDVSEDNDAGDDPVKEQVEKAFTSFADENFKAAGMPSGVNEKNVITRIKTLLKSESDDEFSKAVEIVSFYEADLLTEKLAVSAITKLFDDSDAEVLINGSSSARLNFLRDRLPAGPSD